MSRMQGVVVQGQGIRYRSGYRDQMPTVSALHHSEASEPFPDRQRSGFRGMTLWLHVPNRKNCVASRSVQDMGASTLVSISPRPDIGLWVMSSGKPMRRQLSWRGWQTRPWLRHLYGTICEPSTADRGAAAFISSLPVIPASPSASPGFGQARTIPATFGRRSPGSSGRPRPNGCSARMSKVISTWDSPKSSESFRQWALTLKRDCSRREKLAQATGVAASSSWPTPTASDAGYFPELVIGQGSIQPASPLDIAQGSCGQFSLANASRVWTNLFLVIRALGLSMSGTCPSSPPVRVSFKHGPTSSLVGLISNPRFYEHLMGWPIGWTAPEEPVTEFAVWLRRSRGALSKLLI
ncbi:hypothetical protein SAMN02927924_01708 [Sphingobium faniae]|nr:hypothetical protein SAMN02927924_01708 [Sphingobium faniae]